MLALGIHWGSRAPVSAQDLSAVAAGFPDDPAALDAWIADRERRAGAVVEGAREHISWRTQPGTRTRVSLLYLHGFSASPRELHPTLELIADDLDANVVYVRLRGHGLQGGDLSQVSASAWLRDGERGYQLASRAGEQVVIVATSTGVPIALDLMQRHATDDALAAGIFTSPNLAVRNPLAELLVMPWGAAVITTVMPGRCGNHKTEAQRRFWTHCYDSRAVVAMQDLLVSARQVRPESLTRPIRVLYNPLDPVVDVQYAKDFLGRAPDVRFVEASTAPDEDPHVLAGELKSPSGTEPTRQQVVAWVREQVEVPARSVSR